MSHRITIIQVAHSMGVELDNEAAWSIGSAMATAYAQEFGEQPPKELRPKTSGQGSHCFAVYPPKWEGRIKSAILSSERARKAQCTLFE